MKQKKSKFITFLLSFLPGAAEMYMGFMKNGISLMAVFFLSFVVFNVLGVSDVFILIIGLIWFYGFFHARNLAAYSEEDLRNLQDEYIWEDFFNSGKIKISNPALRKWGAILLILYGLVLLWDTVSSILFHLIPNSMLKYLIPFIEGLPQVVIALVIIAIGLHLIAGKKEELYGERK